MSTLINSGKKMVRNYLDELFIQSAKYRVSNFDYVDEGRKILQRLRICLIKQETFSDLYTQPNLRGKDLLFSTIHRSGPIGLFGAKFFEFFIVRISNSEESRVWKYLREDMNGPNEQQIISFKDQKVINGKGERVTSVPQSKVAISMNEIGWDNYDVIISINFSIDEELVKAHPMLLWCYLLQEPSMRHYKKSMIAPLFSYDLFLNQKFTYQVEGSKPHQVNFPYNFMNSQSFVDLVRNDSINRRGILIEIHTVGSLTGEQMQHLEKYGEVRFPQEELFENVLQKMYKSKYFFSLRGNRLAFKIWGNSMIDAVGAGLLAFGNPKEYHNLGLFTPFTSIATVEEFIKKIEYLERNPLKHKRELVLQQKLLNKYCFFNPLRKIRDAYNKKQMA